jgi:hypothetical protein
VGPVTEKCGRTFRNRRRPKLRRWSRDRARWIADSITRLWLSVVPRGAKGGASYGLGRVEGQHTVPKMAPILHYLAEKGHREIGNTRSLGMGPYCMTQGSCSRSGATVGAAVAALLLRACAQMHCMAHGVPMQPSPKVPDGHYREPNRLHMMYDSCWEGVHAGRGPRSLFCGRAVGLTDGARSTPWRARPASTAAQCHIILI